MMSRNMNNFTPLPGLRRTDSRAYDAPHHTSDNPHEFNDIPVFYRSHHSSRANNVSLSHSRFNNNIFRIWQRIYKRKI